jgi:uncharacterized protein YjbI with pentapeptide repeats
VTAQHPHAPRLPEALTALPPSELGDEDPLSESIATGDFTGYAHEDLTIERSRIVNARFVAAAMPRLRLTDVVVENVDLSGADLDDSVFDRVVFRDCRMSGVILSRCNFTDVLVTDCRLDDASFRMAEADSVHFEDVDLRQSDFYAARLESTRFFDCNLTGAQFSQARTPGVRLHGSDLTDVKGSVDLAGAVIGSAQVLPLALGILSALQIQVEDERDPAATAVPPARPKRR